MPRVPDVTRLRGVAGSLPSEGYSTLSKRPLNPRRIQPPKSTEDRGWPPLRRSLTTAPCTRRVANGSATVRELHPVPGDDLDGDVDRDQHLNDQRFRLWIARPSADAWLSGKVSLQGMLLAVEPA